jgi:hypothetical protein
MFQDIIGLNLTTAEYDKRSAERFNAKIFKGESQLQQSCWFDYRFMHPMQRTYLFAHYFVKNFKALYEEKIDIDSSRVFGLSRPKDPLDNRPPVNKTRKLTTPTYLWNARRCADFLGIPYDIYCSVGCREAVRIKGNEVAVGKMRSSIGDSKLLLSAANIYDESIVDKIRFVWQDEQRRMTRSAVHEHYNLGEFSHPYQAAHEKHLLRFTLLKSNPEYSLAKFVFEKKMIREVVANKLFTKDVMKRAKGSAISTY